MFVGGMSTIRVYLNFGTMQFFFQPSEKVTYLCRNAYKCKIRARALGNASCTLKDLNTHTKTLTSMFGDEQDILPIVNS